MRERYKKNVRKDGTLATIIPNMDSDQTEKRTA